MEDLSKQLDHLKKSNSELKHLLDQNELANLESIKFAKTD